MSKIIRIDSLHFGDRSKCSCNATGINLVVWFLGCDIHCQGCHNYEYWDFDNPKFEDFSDKHVSIIIDEMIAYSEIYSGLSILGGEPFSTKNIDDVIYLCEIFKQRFPNKHIWIWSGHTFEWLKNQTNEYGKKIQNLFDLCDVLVDGPFINDLRNVSLKFRGSSNQRIIDLKTGKEID